MATHLEVIARMSIRPGQLIGFKTQAAELMRLTAQKDTKTLRYDWFIDEAGMQCEVHELYVSEEGLFEHNMNIIEARTVLFAQYASDHHMSFFGHVSPALVALAKRHAGRADVFAPFVAPDADTAARPVA